MKQLFCGFCGARYCFGEPRPCNCRAKANAAKKRRKKK